MLITNNKILINSAKKNYKYFKVPTRNINPPKSKRHYTFEDLVEFYKGDKKTAKRIYDEIQFCKMMHTLRPQRCEKDIVVKEKK